MWEGGDITFASVEVSVTSENTAYMIWMWPAMNEYLIHLKILTVNDIDSLLQCI